MAYGRHNEQCITDYWPDNLILNGKTELSILFYYNGEKITHSETGLRERRDKESHLFCK